MSRYIGRRLLQIIPVFFGATFLIFAMVYLMPGDPVAALGGDRGLNPEVQARIRAEYNLDKPLYMQYLLYLKGVFTLDFGTTFSGRPVAEVMAGAFPITIKLAVMALLFEAILGVGFGVIAGMRRGGIFDSTVLVLSLQFLVGVKWGILPPTVGSKTTITNLLMPAIVLGAQSLAYVLRLTRQSVSEHTAADFVRTARAKGLSNGQVMRRHILRNSLIPVVTFLGGDLGALMGGAIITEGIFIANLIVDLLYAWLDPRIRYE